MRAIPRNSRAYQAFVRDNKAAEGILLAAGFTRIESSSHNASWQLSHYNVARLDQVIHKVEEIVDNAKFAKMKSSPSLVSRVQATSLPPLPNAPSSQKSPTKPSVSDDPVMNGLIEVGVRGWISSKEIFARRSFSGSVRLCDALEMLLEGKEWSNCKVEVVIPHPSLTIDTSSSQWTQSISELAGNGREVVLSVGQDAKDISPQGGVKKRLPVHPGSWKKRSPPVEKITANATSKANEFFGGDSTVFLSVDNEAPKSLEEEMFEVKKEKNSSKGRQHSKKKHGKKGR